MKKKTVFIGILGLIIFSAASLVKQFSPTSISDFYYGFFSGIALVCIVVMLILSGCDLHSFFKKRLNTKKDENNPNEEF
ncbi:MAG: hypothetical protein WCX48_05785 [Bacteroidales bacterium]|jgi:hypothetical protein